MKRLFIIATLVCGTAFAGTFATAPNKSDGLLVLTDTPCSTKGSRIAYSTATNKPTLFGCWFSDDNFVFITWSDGETSSFPFGIWTIKAKTKSDAL